MPSETALMFFGDGQRVVVAAIERVKVIQFWVELTRYIAYTRLYVDSVLV
jgi:hypothetical protein